MNKHTDGPWRIGLTGLTVCSNDGILADVRWTPNTERTAFANAALMAEAPALLTALKLIEIGATEESIALQFGASNGETLVRELGRIARAAIAKARGE